uniref:Dendritic cell-specific transmembrane protein-like domain-containing protein n=1 Tax=Denticeps clupeoides TaxID=299321 RepID=A0AAY4C8B2_9TELE
MQLTRAEVKRTLSPIWSNTVQVLTAKTQNSWRGRLLLLAICFIISLVLTVLIVLGLEFSLLYGSSVSTGLGLTLCITLTAGLTLSHAVRCFSVLLLISCLLRQGRNLLLTVGTTLVVIWNIHNTLANIKNLAKSILCNLEAKKVLVDLSPLKNYVEMLKWIGGQLQVLTDLGLVRLNSEFKLTPKAQSKEFQEKVFLAKKTMNETATIIEAVLHNVSSVAQRLFPVLGLLMLMALTALYLRRFYTNTRFQNDFITEAFVQFDKKEKEAGRPSVLPLTKKEMKRYATIPSPRPTAKEGKAIIKFGIPVFKHLLIWLFFIGLDTLIYWLIMVLQTHLNSQEFHLLGIFPSMDGERRDFSYSVPLFEKKCRPSPKLHLYKSVVLLVILAVLAVLGYLSSKLTQIRLLVLERFYAELAEERARQLHVTILRKREKWRIRALKKDLANLLKKVHFWCPILFKHENNDFDLT